MQRARRSRQHDPARRRREPPRLRPLGQSPAPVPLDRIGRNLRRSDGRDRGRALLRAQRRRLRRWPAGAAREPQAGKVEQGGSTITMQLMRSLCFPTPSATSSARSRRRSWRLATRSTTPRRRSSTQYLNSRLLRHGRRSHRDRRPGRLADLLLAAGSELTLEQAALLAGLPQAPSDYNPMLHPSGPPAPQPGARQDGRPRLHQPGRERRRRCSEAWRSNPPTPTPSGREPYFFDYVERALIARYGVDEVRTGGLRVQTTIEPALPGGRPRCDRLGPSLLQRSVGGAGRDRPPQRLHPGDGLERLLRLQPVQPRRPGPPPARIDLQDVRADHGDQAGDRPLPHLLHVEAAQPRPAPVGPLGRPHRRRGLHGHRQPAAGHGRLRQHRLRPARPRRRTRERWPGRPVDGDHDRARRDPCGRARRPADRGLAAGDGRCLATLASGGIHRNPVAISKVSFPGGRVEHPEQAGAAAGAACQRGLRGDPDPPRQHHLRDRHRRLHGLLRPGRQDRHHRQLRRRLVRRLPAQPGDGGLGRLPAVQRRSR